MHPIIPAALMVFILALSVGPAAAISNFELTCKLAGKHVTAGHCCPMGQDWISLSGAPAKCQAPSMGGFGIQLGIDDPRFLPTHQKPCKALHTC